MKNLLLLLLISLLGQLVLGQSYVVSNKYNQPDGDVNAIVRDTLNNRLYVGGDFDYIGNNERFGSQLDTNGKVDFYFDNPIDGGVEVSVPDGNGGWYIGGRFNVVGDSNRTKIAHLDSNGKVTDKFKNLKFSHEVKTMLLQNDTLFVGGEFTIAGNLKKYNSVRDIDDGSMTKDVPEADGLVYASVPDGQGGVFIAGIFDHVEGVPRSGLAQIDKYGNLTAWNPSSTGSSSVYAIKLAGDTLFVGGHFAGMGGQQNQHIAAIDKSTGTVFSWGPILNSAVYTVEVSGNEVFFGGQFTQVNGVTRNNMAVCNKTTGALNSWNPNFNGWIKSIKVFDNKVYVGGRYTTVGGQSRNRIASFNLSSKALTSWNPNVATTPNWSIVECIEKVDTLILIGGNFDSVGGQIRGSIAAVNATTGLLTSWNPSIPGNVYEINYLNNELFVVGAFTSVSGSPQTNVVKYDSNFTQLPWRVYSTNQVYTACAFGSDLFLGGFFDAMGKLGREHIAAVDVVGDSVLAWDFPANGPVYSLEYYNNKLYVGGNYSTLGTSNRNSLGAIDLSTQTVTNLDPQLNLYASINDFHVADSKLYFGGKFYSINGQIQYNLGQIDLNTNSVTSWNANIYGNSVFTIESDANNIYVGGDFIAINGLSHSGFAQLLKTNASLGTLNPKPNGTVYTIKKNGNNLIVGGNFTSVLNPNSSYVQRDDLAEIDLLTGQITSFNPNINGSWVKHMAWNGSKYYCSGSYIEIGRLKRQNFVAYNYATGEVIDWNPSPNSTVNSMVVKDSLLYIGGDFNYIDNIYRKKLAALNVVSQTVDSINNLSSTNWSSSMVTSLAIKDSTLFVGGSFTSLNGQPRTSLGSFNTNTKSLNTLNTNFNAGVNDFVIVGNDLFLGGSFSSVGGQTRNKLVKLNASTGAVSSWAPSITGTEVNAVFVNGSSIIIGGEFTQAGGQNRSNIASINGTTGSVNSWNPSLNGSGNVQDIVSINNEFLVGKEATGVAIYNSNNLEKVNITSGSASSWNAYLKANTISEMTTFNDTIIMGGDFKLDNIKSYLALMVPCSSVTSTDIQSACNSLTWVDGVTYYTSNNTATTVLTSTNGCDSIVTLDLTILNSPTTTVSVTACDSFSWNGLTYYASTNSPEDTLLNMAGCDSVLNLNLVINYSSFYTDSITACDSYTWIDGVTYYSDNHTAMDTIQNVGGCDSIVSLALTILRIDSSVTLINDTLNAVEAGMTYEWFDCGTNTSIPGATFQEFVPLVSGSYKVVISNATCVDTSACFQVNLCDNQSSYTISNNGNGDIDFTDNSLGVYNQLHWSFGDGTSSVLTNPNHVYQANGNYVVVLTINDSLPTSTCTSYYMDTISITGIASSLACQAGFSVYYDSVNASVNVVNSSMGSNLTYSWDFGDGSNSTSQFPSHTYATNGPFNLCLTIDDGNGCTDTYCDSISNQGVWFRGSGFDLIVEGAEPNSISKIDLSNNITIYPNPVYDQVSIDIANWSTNAANIVVRDMSGKTIFTKSVAPVSSKETISINTSKWASGTYFMEVSDGEHRLTEKIVVRK